LGTFKSSVFFWKISNCKKGKPGIYTSIEADSHRK